MVSLRVRPLHRGWIALFLAAVLPLAAGARELGRGFLQIFAPRDYRAHNQVWHAAQDARGVMYFGNRGVVLEYDGASWRRIPVGETTFVRGLALEASSGRIFVGGVDELGFLEDIAEGEKRFVSLRDHLPPDARAFGDLWRVFALPDGVFFVASRQVMRWREGAFRVWKFPNSSTLRSDAPAGRLHVQHPDLGLLRFEDEDFRPASPEPLFRQTAVASLLAHENGARLAATVRGGLAVLDPEGRATPWRTEIDDWLRAKEIRAAARLEDGSLAIATGSAGLVVVGRDGRLLARLDEASGLPTDRIIALFRDREGGLWLSLNSGVVRADLSPAVTLFDSAAGLRRATAHQILRWRGQLHAATNAGVFRMFPAQASGDPRPARWEKVPGLDGVCWTLCAPAEGAGLLVGGEQGVFVIGEDDRVAPVMSGRARGMALHASRAEPGRILAGDADGRLHAARWDPASRRWNAEGALAAVSVGDNIRSIAEPRPGEWWLGTPLRGAFRVRVGETGAPSEVTRFFESHGLPRGQGWTRAFAWEEDTVLATQAGLFRLARAGERFEPVPGIDPRLADGSFAVGELARAADGSLWCALSASGSRGSDVRVGRAAPDGSWRAMPARLTDWLGSTQSFFAETAADGTEVVWISGVDGVARVNPREMAARPVPAPARPLIRRATAGRDATRAVTGEPLPFDHNSLRFEFASPNFAAGPGTVYQTRVVGFQGGEWSGWSPATVADYTNLPEGEYRFEMRSRDADGRETPVGSLDFRVLPPWQRTPWAYAGALALIIGSAFTLVRGRSLQLIRQNEALEAQVAARTGELRRAKEAAESADRAKSAFLAGMSHELRTPLHAILGYAEALRDDPRVLAEHREQLRFVGSSGEHLLGMINDVLDFAKTDASPPAAKPVAFSPARLVEEVCASFRAPAAAKGLELRGPVLSGLPATVRGDATKLRQVLLNLVDNAVKFTSRGHVAVSAAAAGPGRVRFEVSDTGPGIEPKDQAKVFLPFYQAVDHSPAVPGAGLGLAISRRLAQLLGGEIGLESAPGQGSRFWIEVELPAVGTAPPTAGLNPAGERPPAEELDALLELSQSGDIVALKARLAELRGRDGGRWEAFAASFDGLVAGYQMQRIRNALRRARGEEASPR